MNTSPSMRAETLIAFDDLARKWRPAGPLPPNYSGFTWCENSWFLAEGVFSSARSGHRAVLLNAHGQDISFARQSAFDLTALSLCSLWMDTAKVLVEGWEEGAVKYRRELTALRNVIAKHELNFRDVDRIGLIAGGAHIVVADFSVITKV